MIEAEHRIANNFILEADAAGALDAALTIQPDEFAERDVLGRVLFLVVQEAAVRRSVRQGQVLQWALAALVTHRAVQRMRGEQELEDFLLRGFGLLGLGENNHALGDWRGAGSFEFRPKLNFWFITIHYGLAGGALHDRASHLDQALAAHADRLHLGVITEDRDVNADLLGRVDDQRAVGNGDLFSINRQCYLFGHS